VLLGRASEQREIELVLNRARSGTSATLALVGETGIGKTALLDHAAERAVGMHMLRARGIESEAQIPFASLLELLRPALARLDEIPRPQAVALEGALALRPAAAQERFAIGAATLSLLAATAEQRPLAVLVDDVQWLDDSSAEALLFAFRRLVADPISVIITAREGEPSLLDGTDLPTLRLAGLSSDETMTLLGDVPSAIAHKLHSATAGNPLALLELAADAPDLELAPDGAPVLVSTRVASAFVRRVHSLDDGARAALVLAAASETGDLATLDRAAVGLGIELSWLAAAETVGLVSLRAGRVEFRHPLVRSAIYADASVEERCRAHRALAGALPDRDVDRRAWHLAAAAVGCDESASSALEQAGVRGHDRSAYATAAAAFERAARLTAIKERGAALLYRAADAAWLAGLADRALALLEQAGSATTSAGRLVEIDHLAGHILVRRGPVMRGHSILVNAAERADPERAVAMLAEAANACFYAGQAADMLAAAERGHARLPEEAPVRAQFLAATSFGMAHVFAGDASAGSAAIHEAIALAEGSPELQEDLRVLPWLAVAPIFLRESTAGRPLLDQALTQARARSAVGALPFRPQPDCARPRHHRQLGRRRGHLPGGHRAGTRKRPADGSRVRARRPGVATGEARARARLPRACRPSDDSLLRRRCQAPRGLGTRSPGGPGARPG
jgi:hypothetical protein